MKTFSDTEGMKYFDLHMPFLRKLPENVLHQNKGVNQKREQDLGNRGSTERGEKKPVRSYLAIRLKKQLVQLGDQKAGDQC